MLIGGQAVLLHGAPRLTEDIDVSLSIGPEEVATVEAVCEAADLESLVANPVEFARETFVLPARSQSSGIRVDFIFSNTDFERLAVDRAVGVRLSGETVPFASPEDLLLLKLFAGRARDIEDARSVVDRQAPHLDWSYVERWAQRLPKSRDARICRSDWRNCAATEWGVVAPDTRCSKASNP